MNGSDFQNKLVFVGGLHRSGTSLIHHCIARHPDVSGFAHTGVPEDEGQHLQSVYRPAKEHGGPGKFGFDPAAHLTEDSPLATPESATLLMRQWAPHWNLSAMCLVEKSPPTIIHTRFLQALFPEARFIIILRHPVAVSYATQKWSETPLHQLLKHWFVCHDLLLHDLSRVHRVLLVRYEDFVGNPNGALGHIFRFLELSEYPSASDAKPRVNDRYFQRFNRLAEKDIVRRMYHDFLQRQYERRARAFGYSFRKGQHVLATPRLNRLLDPD